MGKMVQRHPSDELRAQQRRVTRERARRPQQAGFFKRHLVGDYSLARSYWLHTVLLGWGLTFVGAFVLHKIGERYAMRYLSMGVLVFEAAILLAWLWSLIGTWMSALKHLFSGGRKRWAILAMLTLAGGAFATMEQAATVRPFLQEHWEAARGRQPTAGYTIRLVDEGRVVEFTGGINEGAAEAIDRVIADAPKVTTVRLDSPGGWLREGSRMADVVRRYRLHTRVDAECYSSCTLVFLAGVDRTAAERASVGFHRGRPIGGARRPAEAASAKEAELYLRAGLDKAFVQRILATPNDEIWVPSHRELLKAEVLTR
jgi:hypothetical protein